MKLTVIEYRRWLELLEQYCQVRTGAALAFAPDDLGPYREGMREAIAIRLEIEQVFGLEAIEACS